MTDGWRCPGCGACWAPTVERCWECGSDDERAPEVATVPTCWPGNARPAWRRHLDEIADQAKRDNVRRIVRHYLYGTPLRC